MGYWRFKRRDVGTGCRVKARAVEVVSSAADVSQAVATVIGPTIEDVGNKVDSIDVSPIINVLPAVIPPAGTTAYAGRLPDAYQFSAYTATLPVYSANGAALNLAGQSLAISFTDPNAPTRTVFQAKTADGTLSIGGADNNQLTISLPATVFTSAKRYNWILRNTTTKATYAQGKLTVNAAAST